MDSGLYAAYTGLLSRTQALDIAANNLANAGTNGFRAQRETFRNVLSSGLQEGAPGSQVGNTINSFGVLGGSRADLAQGPMVPTANPLDLALNGTGYFAIETAHGVRYTRDGAFRRLTDGTLATGAGEPVLNAESKHIVLPSGDLEVSANGTVSVKTAAGSAVAGRVGTFDFPHPGALVQEGSNRFQAGGQKAFSTETTIKAGALEGANEDAVHGSMQLVLIQRQAEMMQKALSVFHNDFDKTAVEQIARL